MLISQIEKKYKELHPWMDHKVLKERINKKLKIKNLSVASVERLAGIGAGAVRSFLVGKTKSPTLETLSALSQILDCSLPDLLGLDTEEPIVSDEITINLSLYSQTVELIIGLLKERQILISAKELFKAVKEIYLFSEQKKKGILDKEFAEWYLKNVLKSQSASSLQQ